MVATGAHEADRHHHDCPCRGGLGKGRPQWAGARSVPSRAPVPTVWVVILWLSLARSRLSDEALAR